MAFYHTYRPQNFGDIAATQHDVARMLVSSLLTGSSSHAYLFTGSHGIGKTSSARILAKALNCEHFDTVPKLKKKTLDAETIASFPVPCGKCSACVSITQGSAVDVVELDAASNRGIDDIRELRETVRLSPAVLSKKIYIIDEVHMLTTEAFNALLKTLEEPPAHAVFILCTTDKQKVPLTIQSRCMLVSFAKPTVDIVKIYLDRIVSAEKITIDPDALHFIARLAKGAFRDAAKYLEQSVIGGTPVSLVTVRAQFVGGDTDVVERILSIFETGSVSDLLQITHQLEAQNVHFSELTRELIDTFRQIIFLKSGVADSSSFAHFSYFNLTSFLSSHDYGFFSECIDILMKALSQQKTSPVAALPLELAGIRIISLRSGTPQKVASPPPTQTPRVEKKMPPVITTGATDVVTAPIDEPVSVVHAPIDEPPVPTPTVALDGPVTLDIVQNRWSEVVRLMKRYNASMATLMNKCKPVRLEGKTVIVETNYSFHKDMLESSKNRPVIEQAIYELLGAQLRIKGSLSNTRVVPKQVENVKEVSNEDLVAAVQEIFGA